MIAVTAVRWAGLSDIGRSRARNDDRWTADPARGLFVVADGIASTPAGDVAAQLVVDLLPAFLSRHLDIDHLGETDAAQSFGAALAELSDELRARSRTDLRLAGMGTTVIAALLTPGRVLLTHLGDSRAYLLRGHDLQLLTADHTLAAALVEAGELTGAEAVDHPARHRLTRYVGMRTPALPDARAMEVRGGERLLLCTDGLHGILDDTALHTMLAAHPDPEAACRALIEAANGAGGPDNITALIVDVPDGQPATVDPNGVLANGVDNTQAIHGL